MTANDPHVSNLELDLVALGQPQARARLDAHAAICPACAARRAEHDEQVRYFDTVVFPRTAAKLSSRTWRLPRWRWSLAFALPVAAGLLFLARGQQGGTGTAAPPPAPGGLGIKGAPTLQIFARHRGATASDGAVTKVRDGDRLAAGDALRFVLGPAGLPYVLIASVDGAAQTSIYFPYQGEASAEVSPRDAVSVPGSIVLDQAPGPERVFVIHSERPISASTARAALSRLAAGGAAAIRAAERLPIEGTVQSTLLFEKAGAP